MLRAGDQPGRRRGDARGARARGRGGAAQAADAARPRGRVVHRAARQRPHDHRGLSVVHRLGPRHVHRDARTGARARTPSTSPHRSCSPGRTPCRKACCRIAFPTTAASPNSTPSTRRCGSSSSSTNSSRRRARRMPCARASPAPSTAILDGYAAGTRFGIRMDDDGLLACGVPGVQLTWMDARVDGRVITPRIGKPVEIQALWINALRGRRRASQRARGPRAGGVWRALLECRRAARCTTSSMSITSRARRTPACGRTRSSPSAGCRTVWSAVTGRAPSSRRSSASCSRRWDCARWRAATRNISRAAKAASHSATAPITRARSWPWLIGAFVDAWLNVNGDDDAHRAEARTRFLAPLLAHLRRRGAGPRQRDRRRRSAAHAARLPVPGVVAGRIDPGAGANGTGVSGMA